MVSSFSPLTTVTPATANLPANAASLVIHGTGFSTTPGNNTVTFSGVAMGTVTSATATQLTVTNLSGLQAGSLTAIVTASGVSSGVPVQVATVGAEALMLSPSGVASVLTGSSLALGTANVAYSQTISAEGGTRSQDLELFHHLRDHSQRSDLHAQERRPRHPGHRRNTDRCRRRG